jgi:hypothetical protein
MRLFNQTKNQLRWSMGGKVYEAGPWDSVEIPDQFGPAARKLGLPLAVAPVAPETRAQVRVADESAAAAQEPLRLLRKAADEAQAGERAAKEELERLSVELSAARAAHAQCSAELDRTREQLARANSDREAAERLLTETAAGAEASEARAVKAETLMAEKSKAQRPDKPKPAG